MRKLVVMVLLAAGSAINAAAQSTVKPWTGPIFDAHLHYNDDAVGVYSVGTVSELFRKNGVAAILANSRPNDGSRTLFDAKLPGVKVVPFIRVYRNRDDYGTWFNRREVYEMIVAEHKRGYYKGIGEFHVDGANADAEWLKKIAAFAVENNLILHAHCDEDALERIFAHTPKARIIWAHTGFFTPLDKVEALLKKYPQLWGELSYRHDVANENGKLDSGWKALFEKYPDRFLLGSDTWVNQRWQTYPDIMAQYRRWLGYLPPAVAERVAWKNGAALFGLQ
jgi:Amidohydrolase